MDISKIYTKWAVEVQLLFMHYALCIMHHASWHKEDALVNEDDLENEDDLKHKDNYKRGQPQKRRKPQKCRHISGVGVNH